MPSELDNAFVEAALEAGLMTSDEASTCRQIIARYEEAKRPKTLPEVAVAKKFLSSEEVRRILVKIGRRIVECPSCRARSYAPLKDSSGGVCQWCGGPLTQEEPAQTAPISKKSAPQNLPPGAALETKPPQVSIPSEGRSPAKKPAPAESENLSGQRLAHLELIEKLGSGGMGAVYKANNINLGRVAAVKVLSAEVEAQGGPMLERFLREARAAAKLIHPNVVQVYYIGKDKGRHFIEMEFVDGRSLGEMIASSGPLPPAQAIAIIRQTAEALAAAHEQGLIHRDIKPDNILISANGVAKVSDFGLAKIAEDGTALTLVGQAVGTPNYMSPEIISGAAVDARTDIYSLGITFYEAVTGKSPFRGDSVVEVLIKQKAEQPKHPNEVNPALPKPIGDVIMKMIAKDPAARYQSARELIHALERLGQLTVPFIIEVRPDGSCVEHPLGAQPLTVGRASTNRIVIRDNKASKEHARFFCDENGARVADLDSRNGTWVNEERVKGGERPLHPGDVIRVGLANFVHLLAPLDPHAVPPTPPAPKEPLWRLTFLSGTRRGEEVCLGMQPVVVGRHRAATCRIADEGVCELHAQLRPERGRVQVVALSPAAELWQNGQKVADVIAAHADVIGFGPVQVRLELLGTHVSEQPSSLAAPEPAGRAATGRKAPAPGIVRDPWADQRLPTAKESASAPSLRGPELRIEPEEAPLELAETPEPAAAPIAQAEPRPPSASDGDLLAAIRAEAERVERELGLSGVVDASSLPGQRGIPLADGSIPHGLILTGTTGPLKDRHFPLSAKPLLLGRDPKSDICLNDVAVSRHHCRFEPVGDEVVVHDLQSANGVFVNGKRVKMKQVIKAGDIIKIGSAKFIVHI